MKRTTTLNKLNRILKKIKSYRDKMKSLSDEELQGLTDVFKQRLDNGDTLDDILPEAFAAICEADYRVLGMFPFDVQILGGIGLHQGKLCEMNTGEGKTLVATMPLYLNALTGRGVILVTTNDYLASRDCEEMGQVYTFMGLTVACGINPVGEESKQSGKQENERKKEIYNADIVYTTNNILGFDYLLNNLVKCAEDRFLREFYYVIIDEADQVLLDSAQMPLVIAGSPRVQSNLYSIADFFVTTLVEDLDYETEEGVVWFTDKGIEYAETFFGIDNFYSEKYFEINRCVNLALRAHTVMELDKDYMITDKQELVLLDKSTGRGLPGIKLRGGIQQAMEVKEGLKPSQETRSVASVTYQNLFGLFEKIGGMSGTISDTKHELKSIYGLDTVVIPPNRRVLRIDMKDHYYTNKEEQIEAALKVALRAHDSGQPVLMVVAAFKDTERISERLIKEKIPHNVLNANNESWEASIIKEAGTKGAITVATSMAGRGTDIKLKEGVRDIGGLMVIGVGRMSNIRLERQARGRAGRQGDPGMSRFFVSLEDDIVKKGEDTKIQKYIDGTKKIGKRKLRRIIDESRKLNEESAETARMRSTDYDKVIKRQRQLIYATRNRLLDGDEVGTSRFVEIADEVIGEFVKTSKHFDRRQLNRFILDNISYTLVDDVTDGDLKKKKYIKQYLLDKVDERLDKKRRTLGDERFEDFIRVAILSSIDECWVEEVDYLQQLQSAVSGRSTAQRNPVFEFQNDALESYRQMEKSIFRNILRNVLLSSVDYDEKGKIQIVFP